MVMVTLVYLQSPCYRQALRSHRLVPEVMVYVSKEGGK